MRVVTRVLTMATQPEAWSLTFEMLHTEGLSPQVKLFAATTLKGKVRVHDIVGHGRRRGKF
jgi:hypothetical protein